MMGLEIYDFIGELSIVNCQLSIASAPCQAKNKNRFNRPDCKFPLIHK